MSPKVLSKTLITSAALLSLAFIPFCTEASMSDTIISRHVLTWASDDGGGGQTDGTSETSTNATSKRHIQTWVSFAEMGVTRNLIPGKAYRDCGASGSPCKVVIYYDPVKLYAGCWPDRDFISENTSEDFYLHDSFPPSPSNRTMEPTSKFCNNSPIYYPNWNNPAVGRWFARTLLWSIPKNDNTMMFQDDSNAECVGRFHKGETYTPVELQGGLSCEAALVRGLRTVADQMRWPDGTPVPVITNGFSVQIRGTVAAIANSNLVVPGSNIIGGVSENAIISADGYAPPGVFADVNTASLVYAKNPNAYFGLLGRSTSPTGSTQACTPGPGARLVGCGALQQRRDLLAAFWLAYKPEHTFLWERFNFDNPHILAVYPEASIVPTEPVQELKTFDVNTPSTDGSGCGPQPGSGGIQSFVVSCGSLNNGAPAGVYVREFQHCYNFGQLVGSGQCAVVMNTTNDFVTVGHWLKQTYTNSMVLGSGPTFGADVLTAGCDDSRCPAQAINPLGAPFAIGQTKVAPFDALFLFHN
jgi:hypothetical protein